MQGLGGGQVEGWRVLDELMKAGRELRHWQTFL